GTSEYANIQILSLTWLAPALAADTTPHRQSYPSAARSPTTLPSPRVVSAGLFSTHANRGRTSPMIRAISVHIPDLSPSIPAPVPAVEISWQGNPPETTSTSPRQGRPSNVRTSSQIGKGERSPSFWRAARTLAA